MDVEPGRAGGIWVLSGNNGNFLSYWNHAKADHVPNPFPRNSSIQFVIEDIENRVWTSSDNLVHNTGYVKWIARLDPDSRVVVNADLSNSKRDILSMVIDSKGEMWFGHKGGISKQAGAEFIALPGRFSNQHAEYLMVNNQDAVWVSCPIGIVRWESGRWLEFPWPEHYQKNQTFQGMQDQEGNFWFATRGNGLQRIRLGKLKTRSVDEGLIHFSTWAICKAQDGGLWIGTGGGFSHWKDGEFNNYGRDSGLPHGWITSLCETRSGLLYIGTRSGTVEWPRGVGLSHLCTLKDDRLITFNSDPLMGFSRIWALYEDSRDILWMGTSQGLFQSKDNHWTQFTEKDGLSNPDVRAIVESPDGTLWIGTNGGGVNHYVNGSFQKFTTNEGLSNDNAWSIHLDQDDAVWVGTEYGLNRIKDGQCFSIFQEHGLFDDLVNHLMEDDFGNFWISCNRGIYRVGKKDLDDLADGKVDHVQYVAYGTTDGMRSSETNGEFQPAGCKTADGKLYFPTSDGFVEIDPKEILSSRQPHPIVIESFQAEGHTYYSNAHSVDSANTKEGNPSLNLPAGTSHFVEIKYSANCFSHPERIQFKYRLRGHHEDWIQTGSRRVAYFSNLNPGEYQFQVKAANANSALNLDSAQMAFVIAPHFYQRTTFHVALGFLILGLGLGVHRMILMNRMRVAGLESQVTLNRERSRIAQDLHDEMGAVLTQITMLGELADREKKHPDRLSRSIAKIKSRSRSLTQSVDEIVWATNPKQDTLESLVSYFSQFTTNFLHSTGIDSELQMPSPVEIPDIPLDSKIRHHLYLIYKEALTNIVKHAEASKLSVVCHYDQPRFSMTLTDNGIGFQTSHRADHPHDNGLINMEDRMRQINGSCEIHSIPGEGTQIHLFVDLSTSPSPNG
jgi:signal transduction histidine kinase/ligand-binding sensor domain-containing protein